MKKKGLLLIAIWLLGTGAALAQTPRSPRSPRPPRAPRAPRADAMRSIRGNLFPPELIMRNQKTIDLKEDQKDAIRQEIRQAELKFLDLKWQVQDAAESLREVLKQEQVDEEEALTLLEGVMEAEGTIKRTQFTLMIRIKNILTPEQQDRLRELGHRGVPTPEEMQTPETPSQF